MGMRIRPIDIEIPENDPFKYDLLGREKYVEALTRRVRSIEGPCTIAIDADWGNGKTTFIKLWERYLPKEAFQVISFNAWENDFINDPLVAISAELIAGGGHENGTIQRLKDAIKQVTLNLVNAGTGGIITPDLMQAALQEASPDKPLKDRLESYQAAKNAIQKMQSALEGMVDRSKQLIVMVDELDRCRPSYAVELLETVKHLFSVDGIVFVLAINRSALAHSIRGLYGAEFKAEDYLQRFFDISVRLPAPDKKAFIEDLFRATQISMHIHNAHISYQACLQNPDKKARRRKSNAEVNNHLAFLHNFADALNFTLRQIQQAIHRLALVVDRGETNIEPFFRAAMTAVIFRMHNETLYHDFITGRVNDMSVSHKVFGSVEGETQIEVEHRERAMFEAVLITVYEGYLAGKHKGVSPLKNKYMQEKQSSEYASQVLSYVSEDSNVYSWLRNMTVLLEMLD